MRNFNRVIAAALLVLPAIASSSTFTGKIQALRIDTNVGGAAGRASIIVGAHGSPCPLTTAFGFNNASSGVGLIWTQALIDANSQAQTIFIQGSGVCDANGVEGVNFIDFR